MLKITSEGRKAALDLRLMKPSLPGRPAGQSESGRRKHSSHLGGDQGRTVPPSLCSAICPRRKTGAFPFINDMADKVGTAGHPGKRNRLHSGLRLRCNAKLALFRDVRAGKVRVLFGSTQKMGSGTNVQERLIALHHLDAPWRPADVEQREGRILRQGNKNSSRADLPLRHRRLVRRLYVADVGDQGEVHRAGDERRHDDSPPRRHGLRRVDLRRGQSHRVRQSARD